ncbi:NAD-dependent epimerase/dehydratase family protein [Ornithinimicrobium faecis]|uniref:NAD-dependent epimerase/dehydratase family protein n=1 Tax=Ornithinimicrobium faecis TaxID=2934158 RepID=A0ABY4YS44_9MICO|nr:NAD-dependent epimerase/dehydratase family protein [Ornithinimicrobium sp. HY1793]USQ79414.1 NAD-dependent epimerase/dehydratase family protein [Ornithinimicrobium sp. HY1793]
MRFLVTGASGMLGRAVADTLAERGEDVTVLQRRPSGSPHHEVLGDVADPIAVQAAVDGQDAVIHLAAKVNVVGAWEDYRRTNIEGTRALVEASRAGSVQRFVQVSSPSVAHAGDSLAGVGAGPADPERARGNYARSKAAAELIALGSDGPDLTVTAVRPHLVWGPGDTQLIGRILQRAKAGRLPILGRGTSLVDTTYVTNAADAIVAALDRAEEARGRALVVTNGEPRPIGELISDICRAGGAPPPRLRIPARAAWAAGAAVEGVMALSHVLPGVPPMTEPPLTRFLAEQLSTAHWFDQRETRQVLDWTPRVSLAEGLELLAEATAAEQESTDHESAQGTTSQ